MPSNFSPQPSVSSGLRLDGLRPRRSTRLACRIPIRVFGRNLEGRTFYEDSSTLVITREGGLIRLAQTPAPNLHIYIHCHPTNQGGRFRVVGEYSTSKSLHRYWGVELLKPAENLWGIEFPDPGPEDGRAVRVILACPNCRRRERQFMDEAQIEFFHERGGVIRECPSCKISALWKGVPYFETV